MDAFVKRVVESQDAERMARVLETAEAAWLDRLVELSLQFWDRPGQDRKAASLLLLRMATAFALGKDYPRAARLATVLADHAMETGDREMLCPALGTIGVILMDSGQTLEARRVFDEILTLTDKTGDAHSRARALHNLGILEALEKRDTRAVAFFEEAATVARSTQDEEVAALSGRFLSLAAEAPVAESASPPPQPAAPPATAQPCPACQGQGLVHKEDYGMVLCPTCKGACRV